MSMLKGKRGVSPVIATVLLVGMVIVTGLIVFTWIRGLSQEAITKFGGQNIELSCKDVSIDGSYSNGQLSISNPGNVPVYGIKLKISGTGISDTKNIRDLTDWPLYGIDRGGAFSGDINLDGASEVTLIPVLVGDSESGRRSFTCDGSDGFKIQIN